MDSITFEVERREISGKGSARQIRREGHIPGIIYGKKTVPQQIRLDPKLLQKRLDNPKRINTVFALNFPGESETIPTMIKELQVNPLTKSFLHVDFAIVSADDTVEVNVPIELQGDSEDIKAGGKLELLRRKLNVRCLPENIPAIIPINISAMVIGSQLRIKDITLDDTLESVYKDNFSIVRLKASRDDDLDEDEEEGEEAAPVETEEKAKA